MDVNITKWFPYINIELDEIDSKLESALAA